MARYTGEEPTVGRLSDEVGRHWIWLHCSNVQCRHSKKHDPLDLLERLGDLPLQQLHDRAKCERCGTRGAKLTIQPSNHPDGSDAPRKPPPGWSR